MVDNFLIKIDWKPINKEEEGGVNRAIENFAQTFYTFYNENWRECFGITNMTQIADKK